MANTRQSDKLLAVSMVGLRIYIGFTVLSVTGVAALMIIIAFFPPPDVADVLAEAPPITLPLLLLGAATVAAVLVLGVLFAMQLLRIIATVKNGDPFDPANADRLTRMGWCALGATVGSWVVSGLGGWLARYFEGMDEVNVSPFAGLALVVTLAVLARVFRHGAAMRDDLIGTV